MSNKEKVVKEGRYFTTKYEGKTYKVKFYHNFCSGARLGEGSHYFEIDVWEIKHLKMFKFNIPYPVHIHSYTAGSYSGCYSCGSFKYSSSLDEFYMNLEDAKWLVPMVLQDKESKDLQENATKKAKKSYEHQSHI